MGTPSAEALAPALLQGARFIAERVGAADARAWIVGGPVRDLVLGKSPSDLDMASALLPEQVEALFERTTAVGKAFGTVLVHTHGLDVQVTTFRRERGFSDARRPDRVEYSEHLEEDARRRDFTCNALYLDPQSDELRDPEGGMADIAARVLRAVGDPRARFAEDGLRLVRLARFAAALDFAVDPATLEGAAASTAAMAGVSSERRLGELERIFGHPRSPRALRLLAQTGLLEALLPGYAGWAGGDHEQERRLAALESIARAGPPGSALGLATLLWPGSAAHRAEAERLLEFLRPSRALRASVLATWRLEALLRAAEPPTRAELVRFARRAEGRDAVRLATAQGGGTGPERWQAALDALPLSALHSSPWIVPADLAQAGIARGPRWKELLHEAETLQLDEAFGSREEALLWLAQRARE